MSLQALCRSQRAAPGCWLLVAVILSLAACRGDDQAQPSSSKDVRLELIAQFLAHHINDFGRRPADEQAFREYIRQRGIDPLQAAGLSDVDDLLKSARDGKQYVVLYEGQQAVTRGEIWAYEAEGKDGQRVIVDSLGRTEYLTEEDFRRLVPNG